MEPQEVSPAHHIGAHTPPTLILPGKSDTTVPYASVAAFERATRKAGKPCKLVGCEGAGHGFFNGGEATPRPLGKRMISFHHSGGLKSEISLGTGDRDSGKGVQLPVFFCESAAPLTEPV